MHELESVVAEIGTFTLMACLDMSAWDVLVNDSPQGHVFSKSSYLRSLGRGFMCYEVKNKNQETVAGVAVIEDSGRMAQSPYLFCPYQGILFTQKISQLTTQKRILMEFRITKFLMEHLLEIYQNFSMSLSPFFRDLRPFIWHNYGSGTVFEIRQKYTANLSLSGFDLILYLNKIRSVRRQEYNKSNSIVKDSSDIGLFLNMYVKTFNRQGLQVDPMTLKIVEDVCLAAMSGGYGHMSCACVNGRVASMAFILFDEYTAYYLFGVNEPDMRKSNASTRLMIENIQNAVHKGVKNFDFVGVNSPQRGDYKLSFAPEIFPYHEVHFQNAK